MVGRVGAQPANAPGRQFALVAGVVGGCRLGPPGLGTALSRVGLPAQAKGACGPARAQRTPPSARCRPGAGTRATPGHCQGAGLHMGAAQPMGPHFVQGHFGGTHLPHPLARVVAILSNNRAQALASGGCFCPILPTRLPTYPILHKVGPHWLGRPPPPAGWAHSWAGARVWGP